MTEEADEEPNNEGPFDQFAADVGDREGDPFKDLSREETPDEATTSTDRSETVGDPAVDHDRSGLSESGQRDAETEKHTETDSAVDKSSGGKIREEIDKPAADLDVGRRPQGQSDPLGDVGDRDGDPFEEGGSLFEERDTEGIDPEVVWQDLASADSRGSSGDTYERTFADVSKHSYCEQCEYFSPPPDVACTHEGTDIVEFLDMETVRVVDCPVVAEREELKEE